MKIYPNDMKMKDVKIKEEYKECNVKSTIKLLNFTDTLVIYKGFIDVVRYAISDEGVLLEIECTSPMAQLDKINSFYTTTNSLQQRVPKSQWTTAPDTAFDNVALGGHSQELLWGKI